MRQTEPKMPQFTGPFAAQCREFIETKRALGYRYTSEVWVLETFDKMSVLYKDAGPGLSRALVEKFVGQKRHEAPKSRGNRAYVIREFAAFITRLGLPAFIPEYQKCPTSFTPYIFTEEEIRRLINSADNIKPYHSSKLAHLVYPVLFRVLYGCGLRVSEAISLKLKDVDLKNGILTVRNSKFGKDRIVMMSDTNLKLNTGQQPVAACDANDSACGEV